MENQEDVLNVMLGKAYIRLLILLLALTLMIVTMAGAREWLKFSSEPLLKKSSTQDVIINFQEGMGLTDLALLLQQKHLLDNPKLFILIARFKNYTTRLQAGIYQLDKDDTLLSLLTKIASGKVLYGQLTIVEGTSLRQLISKLNQTPYLTHKLTDLSLENLQDNFKSKMENLEGLFFPDTYFYKAGSSDIALLKRAYSNMQKQLNKIWQERNPGLPYKTPYQLLIAASIIEKETSIDSERQLISGIILNRLNKNMRLQMDPTVIYALGDNYQGKLAHEDMSVDNPYNTYRNAGLPPTPICAPGLKSLHAAAHPLESNYIYFVATGHGEHKFSHTLTQQNTAISEYKKSMQDNLSKLCFKPVPFIYNTPRKMCVVKNVSEAS